MKHRACSLILVGAVIAAACTGTSNPTAFADPAALIFFGDTTIISSPDTVERAQSFTVRIRTFAGGCTRMTARTDVAVNGLIAAIRPYNLTDFHHGTVCPADLMFLDHVATVQFLQPGTGLLRIVGVQYTAGAPNPAPPAVFERRIVVR